MISGLTGDATAVVKMEYFRILGEDRMRFGNTYAQKQAFGLALHSPLPIFAKTKKDHERYQKYMRIQCFQH